jgi:hypothetical protein
VGYTTFSHTEEAPRFRLVIPFTEPVSADDFRDRFFPVLKDFLMEKLDSPLDELDKNCPIPSKIYDLPCIWEGSTPDSIICNGSFLIPELFITKHHAWQALKNIKHDVRYPQWITIGMALHAGLGDEGFAIWNEWSSWGSNYPKVKPEKELASHWKSFNVKEKGVSLGTLFHMAKYHPGERVGGHGQNISASLAEQIVHFLKEIGEPCLPKVIAFGLNKKTENEQGTIRKMLHRLYERGTIHRNSQGAYVDKNDLFKATINVAGHLMCNMAVCGGKKTNFFTLLVTRTGGGKDSIAQNMSKLLEHQGWGDHLESNFVSVQGYERVLQLKGGTLFMITDEAAQWFGTFDGKHTSEHYKKLKTALKINYSGGTYASQNAKEGASFIIKNTFVSCSFLGTPAISKTSKRKISLMVFWDGCWCSMM